MNRKFFLSLALCFIALTALACNISSAPVASPPPGELPASGPSPSPTAGVLPPSAPAPLPAATSTPDGVIAGTLIYPSDYIPPLQVVAFDVNNLNVYYLVQTVENQSEFEILVPPGEYYVVAYTVDGSMAGGYSQAVLCGLQYGCDDHSLIPVLVGSGERVTDIWPHDWYAPPDAFPPKP